MRIGGTEMVIKNLIEGSDHNLFDMSIFCIEEPIGPWGLDLQNKSLQITAKARKPGFDTSLVFAIRKHIKDNKIDVLHCHQYTPWVYGVLAAFGTKTKVIFTEHGRFYPDHSSWKRKLVNPILSKITAHMVSISKATRRALVDFENLSMEDIEVIYNGIKPVQVDTAKIVQLKQKFGLTSNDICLGTIARLDPIKNHQMMLKAFKRVLQTKTNIKLIIVGDGEERANIQQTIEDLQLQDNVILTGYETKPQNHLAMMDIYLLPSFSEGTSMTLLEAMSISKPCVVTDAGGNPEIVEHGVTGFVTPNNNEEAYANMLSKLIDQPELQDMFAKASKKRFDKLFKISHMISAYQQIYKMHLKNNELI